MKWENQPKRSFDMPGSLFHIPFDHFKTWESKRQGQRDVPPKGRPRPQIHERHSKRWRHQTASLSNGAFSHLPVIVVPVRGENAQFLAGGGVCGKGGGGTFSKYCHRGGSFGARRIDCFALGGRLHFPFARAVHLRRGRPLSAASSPHLLLGLLCVDVRERPSPERNTFQKRASDSPAHNVDHPDLLTHTPNTKKTKQVASALKS